MAVKMCSNYATDDVSYVVLLPVRSYNLVYITVNFVVYTKPFTALKNSAWANRRSEHLKQSCLHNMSRNTLMTMFYWYCKYLKLAIVNCIFYTAPLPVVCKLRIKRKWGAGQLSEKSCS